MERRSGSLDEIYGLIAWSEIARVLVPVYAAPKGERAWPPPAVFKALDLAVWYDLSDVKLAEALDDRAKSRRFSSVALPLTSPHLSTFCASGACSWPKASVACCSKVVTTNMCL